jgi:hypothetical protein
MAYNGTPRPTYQKVTSELTQDELAKSAKAIMRKPLAPGSDTRAPVEISLKR